MQRHLHSACAVVVSCFLGAQILLSPVVNLYYITNSLNLWPSFVHVYCVTHLATLTSRSCMLLYM